MKRSKAFTLIELLVVIAIIALLLSILMPALKKVREQGRSNLHQWYLCMNLYASDFDDTFWEGYAPPVVNMWWSAMKVYHEDNNDIRCCPNADKPPVLIVNGVEIQGPGANKSPPLPCMGPNGLSTMEY